MNMDMSKKRKTKLFSTIIWYSVFTLSGCSTIYDVEPEPEIIPVFTSEAPVQTQEKPAPVVETDAASDVVGIKEPEKEKVKAKKIPLTVKKKVVVSRKTAKPAPKKKITKVEPKKTTSKLEKIVTHESVDQVTKHDVTKYKVNLATLPLSVGKNWVLNRGSDSAGQCALSYRKLAMNDGQGKTPVSILITKDRIVFKTKSNIDLEYEQTGLTIDDHAQMPIENLLNELAISYEHSYKSLIDDMKSGEQAILSLGFWPSWPMTHTYSLSFELGDFASAQLALMTCIELESELK